MSTAKREGRTNGEGLSVADDDEQFFRATEGDVEPSRLVNQSSAVGFVEREETRSGADGGDDHDAAVRGLAKAVRRGGGTDFSAPWRASTFPTSVRRRVNLGKGGGAEERTDVSESNRSQGKSDSPDLLPERRDDRDLTSPDVPRRDEIGDEVSNCERRLASGSTARAAKEDRPMLTSCSLKKEAPSSTGSSSPEMPWNQTGNPGEGRRGQAWRGLAKRSKSEDVGE